MSFSESVDISTTQITNGRCTQLNDTLPIDDEPLVIVEQDVVVEQDIVEVSPIIIAPKDTDDTTVNVQGG